MKLRALLAAASLIGSLFLVGIASTPTFAATACPPGVGNWAGGNWCSSTYNQGVYDYANTPSYSGSGSWYGVTDNLTTTDGFGDYMYVGYNANSGGPQYAWGYEEANAGGQGFLGGVPTIGTSHTYEIQYIASDEWGVYVDGGLVGTFSGFADGNSHPFAGVRTAESESVSGQTNSALEYLDSSGSWLYWPSGAIQNNTSTCSASYTTDYSSVSESCS